MGGKDVKNKMKKLIGLLILALLISSYTTRIDTASGGNEASNYEYNDNDIPEICFFPTQKARWNGYAVTTNDWEKLTDYQKKMFISEGIEEIKRNETGKVNVDFSKDGQELLNAMYDGVSRLQKEFPDLDAIMIKFLRDTLKDAGKITE